jgi:hypothetical protein
VLWISIRSNNVNDVEFYPGFSIQDVKKQLEKNVKILNGIYGTTANETAAALGEKAIAKMAEKMAEEETSNGSH